MNHLKNIILLNLMYISYTGIGQSWQEMWSSGSLKTEEISRMIDKEIPNYNEIKGVGVKPYKRWECYWQNRISNETLPNAGVRQEVFNDFIRSYQADNKRSSSANANWTSVGPSTTSGGYAGIGRINSLGFEPTNSSIIYAGSAGGGLWKSLNSGISWAPMTDNLASLGVSSIFVSPSNPSTLFIATGDGDASDNYSIGVLKSVDGGTTWNTTGLNWSQSNNRVIRKLIVKPSDENVMMAASSYGIMRSTNGGNSWTRIRTENFFDIEVVNQAPYNVYFACTNNIIYKSVDAGATWSVTLALTGNNRMGLATSPSNDQFIYAITSSSSGSKFNGLHLSTDQGTSWSLSGNTSKNLFGGNADGSSTNGQGWYDMAMTINPTNENEIHVGGVNHWYSNDRGVTWLLKSHWSGGPVTVHADKHALEWQGTRLWEGNDGGVYYSDNNGTSWVHRGSGLIISQMYKVDVSQLDTKVIAGLQDNGTKALINGAWGDKVGGDGMECSISTTNSNDMYGTIQNGELRRSTNGGSSWSDIQNNIPGRPAGAWVTPHMLNPQNQTSIFAGYKQVFKSVNKGSNWTPLSDSLFGNNNITILSVAPSDSNIIYAGTSSLMKKTLDGGITWSSVTLPATKVSGLEIDEINSQILYITHINYNSTLVQKSINGGSTWTNISYNLPQLPANVIKAYNGQLYVGLDVGVYTKTTAATTWEPFITALPNVQIMDFAIKKNTNKIYAATYGRGVWVSDLIGSVPTCIAPSSIIPNPITYNSVALSWSASNTTGATYEYGVTTSNVPPTGTGIATTNINITATGLAYPNNYYMHVRSKCGTADYSAWVTSPVFTALPTCGQTVYDAGGASSNYPDQSVFYQKICPNISNYASKLTFTSLNIEPDWDALYIHNGPDLDSPIFPSSNGVTQAGYPAGGYYGTTLPPAYTSSHPTGCLFLEFRSDEAENGTGWQANVSCVVPCGSAITSSLDDGIGSIRQVATCGLSTPISFNSSIANDTIILSSGPLTFLGNLDFNNSNSNLMVIKSQLNQPLFTVGAGQTLKLKNMVFLNQFNITPLIINNGTLVLDGVEFINLSSNSNANLIQNTGQITYKNSSKIK